MDPYLEHPAVFPGLHDRLISYLSEALQGVLPEPYYAEISDRVWVEVSQRRIGPDVEVLARGKADKSKTESQAEVAVAIRNGPVVVRVAHDEIREPRLEIIARIDGEQVVTAIEVLSLNNKTQGIKAETCIFKSRKRFSIVAFTWSKSIC